MCMVMKNIENFAIPNRESIKHYCVLEGYELYFKNAVLYMHARNKNIIMHRPQVIVCDDIKIKTSETLGVFNVRKLILHECHVDFLSSSVLNSIEVLEVQNSLESLQQVDIKRTFPKLKKLIVDDTNCSSDSLECFMKLNPTSLYLDYDGKVYVNFDGEVSFVKLNTPLDVIAIPMVDIMQKGLKLLNFDSNWKTMENFLYNMFSFYENFNIFRKSIDTNWIDKTKYKAYWKGIYQLSDVVSSTKMKSDNIFEMLYDLSNTCLGGGII